MKVSAFILILLAVSIQSFLIPTPQPLVIKSFTEIGATVRQVNPSANRLKEDGYINFPKVTKVTPTKVAASAVQTAYITVQVEIDADGPVWLGTGCAIAVPYKTEDPEWYLEKFGELGMDNVFVREDNGIRTSKIQLRVSDFYQEGTKVYSIGAQAFWLDGFYGNWVEGLGDIVWETKIQIV